MLEEQEAFLRAIYDAPDDFTPRLVYADWLEENGYEREATAMRLLLASQQTEHETTRLAHCQGYIEYVESNPHDQSVYESMLRPENERSHAQLNASLLEDPELFRQTAIELNHLFGVTRLSIKGRLVNTPILDTVFQSLALRRVRALDLSGEEFRVMGTITDESGSLMGDTIYDTSLIPTTNLSGVEALANHRGAHRLAELDLRNNNLGNDALRLLARSPHLDNLNRLEIAEGNNFRGRVWQLLIERFGEEVVS